VRPDTSLSMLRMQRARAILIADQPFYGIVSLHLGLVEDSTCETLWCNGVQLGFNPRFVRGCTELELKAILTKMTLHAALGHTWRCEHRDLKLWNEACGYAVAPIIEEAACRLPGKFPRREEFDGWCAEAIYLRLQTEADEAEKGSEDEEKSEEGGGGTGSGMGAPGGPESGEGDDEPSDGESEQDPQDWRSGVVGEIRPAPADCDQKAAEEGVRLAAQQGALAHGDLPGALGIAIKQTSAARVNWKEIIWAFAQASFKSTDYSWSRPNPRYIGAGLYVPRLQGKQTPPMVASVDVSGSIVANPSLVSAFINEIDGINSQTEPERLDVLYVDVAVRLHECYEPGDMVKPQTIPGGGGTSFIPAFAWVQEQGENPCCMVYLTDLLGSFPAVAPDYPVLWVVPDLTGKYLAEPPAVPFGEVVVLPAFD